MSNGTVNNSQLFFSLAGTWTGAGRGGYPTISPFDYQETLTFTRRDEKSLAYEQRTQKRYDGQTDWLVSHWENGFLRILEGGEIELVNAQSGGRSEVLIGVAEMSGSLVRIRFTSRSITNDPRLICTTRTFELLGHTLHYTMEMQTSAVDRLANHLRITLQRTK